MSLVIAANKLQVGLKASQRLHISSAKNLRWKEPANIKKRLYLEVMKPWGLWYGFGGSWMEWCISESPGFLRPYLYEVKIKDESRILKINNIKQFESFEKKYRLIPGFPLRGGRHGINWALVMQRYAGCEINPYLWEKRFESIWYYGWDVASGCIWDKNVLNLKLIAVYDRSKKSYVRQS